jgi:hypothetical protein
MIVNELCEMAGITRQWLNKQADLGKVPGATRQPNERLKIVECAELNKWIKVTSDLQKKKRGKRLSLQQRLARIEDYSTSESYTATELARKTGISASTIKRRVLEIPGAYFDGLRYRFRNSPELSQWIETEIITRLQEKESSYRERLKRASLYLPKAPYLRAGAAVSKARAEINRAIRGNPVKTWGTLEIQSFREDLQYMVNLTREVDKELSRRKEQAKLAASHSD